MQRLCIREKEQVEESKKSVEKELVEVKAKLEVRSLLFGPDSTRARAALLCCCRPGKGLCVLKALARISHMVLRRWQKTQADFSAVKDDDEEYHVAPSQGLFRFEHDPHTSMRHLKSAAPSAGESSAIIDQAPVQQVNESYKDKLPNSKETSNFKKPAGSVLGARQRGQKAGFTGAEKKRAGPRAAPHVVLNSGQLGALQSTLLPPNADASGQEEVHVGMGARLNSRESHVSESEDDEAGKENGKMEGVGDEEPDGVGEGQQQSMVYDAAASDAAVSAGNESSQHLEDALYADVNARAQSSALKQSHIQKDSSAPRRHSPQRSGERSTQHLESCVSESQQGAHVLCSLGENLRLHGSQGDQDFGDERNVHEQNDVNARGGDTPCLPARAHKIKLKTANDSGGAGQTRRASCKRVVPPGKMSQTAEFRPPAATCTAATSKRDAADEGDQGEVRQKRCVSSRGQETLKVTAKIVNVDQKRQKKKVENGGDQESKERLKEAQAQKKKDVKQKDEQTMKLKQDQAEQERTEREMNLQQEKEEQERKDREVQEKKDRELKSMREKAKQDKATKEKVQKEKEQKRKEETLISKQEQAKKVQEKKGREPKSNQEQAKKYKAPQKEQQETAEKLREKQSKALKETARFETRKVKNRRGGVDKTQMEEEKTDDERKNKESGEEKEGIDDDFQAQKPKRTPATVQKEEARIPTKPVGTEDAKISTEDAENSTKRTRSFGKGNVTYIYICM